MFTLSDLAPVPHKPGVYFFYDKKGVILYIGKAKDLKKRVSQYFAPGSLWKQDMLSKATKVDFVIVTTESEALYLEDNLIKKHKPMYNSLLKADNSYVYIRISKDHFPVIHTTRTRIQDGSIYIGPKHFTRDLYKLMQFLRQLFRYRGCTNSVFKQGKLCSDYHFGTCKGWCVYEKIRDTDEMHKYAFMQKYPVNAAFKEQMSYAEAVQENKNIIKILVDFFAGKTKIVEKQIMDMMQQAISEQRFEHAAQLRDIYGGISKYTEKQHVVISELVTGKVMKVREMEGRYVLAIINMYEGKMIDIIRLKYRTSDTDIDDIISDFRAEYGECIVQTTGYETLVYTGTLKKITKKIWSEVSLLLDKFIDAFIASSTFEKENIMNDLLQGLQSRYDFPRFPYIVECTDISHLSGGWTSGSIVSMKEGLLNKKGYRRYKIGKLKPQTASDDYAALREVIVRKFQGLDIENDFIPDVFILDGGIGQLGVVRELYEEKEWFQKVFHRVHFCSLGKGDARKRAGKIKGEKESIYRFEKDWKIVSKQLDYDDVDRLLTTLRDEAHAFANSYRKKQMSMEWKKK